MTTTAEAITLFVFVFLALVPTIAAYALQTGRMILGIVSVIGWLILGIYAYMNAGAEWDILYGLFFFSMVMCIAQGLLAYSWREKSEALDPTMRDYEDGVQWKDENMEEILAKDAIINKKPVKSKRKPVKKRSKFSETGII